MIRSNKNWLMVIPVLGLGGHELGKELPPIVSANKPTGPNAKPKDNVPTSFNRITRHASKVIGRRKKMMWVPKGSTPIKVELITRISTARPIMKSKPHMTYKVLLSKHTNKKGWSLESRSDMEFLKKAMRLEDCKWTSGSLATTSSIPIIQCSNVWTRGFTSRYVYLFSMVWV
jgi:hypothetical protein